MQTAGDHRNRVVCNSLYCGTHFLFSLALAHTTVHIASLRQDISCFAAVVRSVPSQTEFQRRAALN